MAIEEEILRLQLEKDVFRDEDSKISGIAKLAVEKGYSSLSVKQRAVLTPFLSRNCEGFTDPGGYHNDCQAILTGEALKDAYEQEFEYDALLCTSCMDEANDEAAYRESFMKD
ncbi:hypothetical protein ACP3S7_04405 [Phytobacter ursingii]